MENESGLKAKFDAMIGSITDWLDEQDWYKELKTKWEELDPQSRTYLKFAGAGGGVFIVFFTIASFIWSVHSLKHDYLEKLELLNSIQAGNDELRRLRETNQSATGAGSPNGNMPPWSQYIEQTAGNAGVDKSSLTISEEKAGIASETAKEALMDVAIKHVSIKQVVRMAFALESGARPIKLRNLTIDTKADPAGYMDATLAISAFTMVVQK